jgi:hypothetical protein
VTADPEDEAGAAVRVSQITADVTRSGMTITLSPKDNLNKVTLNGVDTFALEGETLLVVFVDGRTRNYPLTHLWYYESHVDNHKSKK